MLVKIKQLWSLYMTKYTYVQVDSKGFWRWCITLRITGFWTLSIVRYSSLGLHIRAFRQISFGAKLFRSEFVEYRFVSNVFITPVSASLFRNSCCHLPAMSGSLFAHRCYHMPAVSVCLLLLPHTCCTWMIVCQLKLEYSWYVFVCSWLLPHKYHNYGKRGETVWKRILKLDETHVFKICSYVAERKNDAEEMFEYFKRIHFYMRHK
jgi:hypothetical protein